MRCLHHYKTVHSVGNSNFMRSIAPRVFADAEMVGNFNSLLPKFESGAFASPFRSTVPLVALVKDDWPMFQEILCRCNLSAAAEVNFEFTGKSPKGYRQPSHTDIMVLDESSALALEAKCPTTRRYKRGEYVN
jgi:hypothetical protein